MAADALDPDQAVRPGEDSGPGGLLARGTAAYLTGDHVSAVQLLQRAYHQLVDRRCPDDALRVAFHLAMVFAWTGQQALFSGWLARAQRLLDQSRPAPADSPSPGRGYVAVLEIHHALGTGDAAAIGALATEVLDAGTRHRDPDLLALGLTAQGRSTLYRGDVPGGLALLDEAMAGVLAGEAGPLATGLVWCASIEACQEIGAVDRLVEWTRALGTWCENQPGLTAFAGECALHTGQVLRLHGAWTEAATEFSAAHRRFVRRGQTGAAGAAERELGDVLRLRGALDEAEAAYRSAAELGSDPQPGLALLWLARGQHQAATAALQRCLAETTLPAHRIALLPAGVEVLLATGHTGEAEGLLAELDALAEATGCAPVTAAAASGHARLELARQDAGGALPYARKAVRLWTEIGCPFEAARARVLLGCALARVGDEQSGHDELGTALSAFTRLGAAPSAAEVEALLATGTQGGPHAPCGLTGREVEVLRLVASGCSNRQVAGRLSLSEKTVARHLSNIFTKIDVGSRTEAAAFAYEHGLA